MVLVNEPDLGEYVDQEAHVLKPLNLGYTDGKRVRSYATKASGKATAGIRSVGMRTGVKPALVVGAFCSRGPHNIVQQVLKPDIMTPGISILAAYSEDPGSASPGVPVVAYQMMSGTSMACPHVAGIAALLQVAHPDWSPAALCSALVTTAATAGNDGHPILYRDQNTSATPLAMGAGHVDADAAMDPGLVYDAGADDCLAFLCSLNYTDAQLSAVARQKLSCKSVNHGGVVGFAQNGDNLKALHMFREMVLLCPWPNAVTLTSVISLIAGLGNLKLAMEIHGRVVRRGLRLDSFLQSALLDMYSKCGRLEDAKWMFRKIEENNTGDVVLWNTILAGYAQNGDIDNAVKVFQGAKKTKVSLRVTAQHQQPRMARFTAQHQQPRMAR